MSDTLESLLERPEEYNGYIIRPSEQAYQQAKMFIASIPDAPQPEFTPDGEGGIDIEWEMGERYLTLSCLSSGKAYIYWREGKSSAGKSGIDEVVNLKRRIHWLTSAGRGDSKDS